jgi:hypothetical protein
LREIPIITVFGARAFADRAAHGAFLSDQPADGSDREGLEATMTGMPNAIEFNFTNQIAGK